MRKSSIIFIYFLLFTPVLFAQGGTFLVPDSIISLSSHQEVNFQDKVFGMALWDELPDSVIQHMIDEWIENRSSEALLDWTKRWAWLQ